MINIVYNDYEISMLVAPPYHGKSSDNKIYDKVIEIEMSDFKKYLELIIKKGDDTQILLLIVPYYTSVDSCMVMNENGLFLMLDSTICLLELETLTLLKTEKINTIGTMFEVSSFENDYILYGEMDIFRIRVSYSPAKNVDGAYEITFEEVWRFSGKDIFVRYQGAEPAFQMRDDRICLYDFSDRYYEIDYDGNCII